MTQTPTNTVALSEEHKMAILETLENGGSIGVRPMFKSGKWVVILVLYDEDEQVTNELDVATL